MKRFRLELILFGALAAATMLGGLEWFERALMDLRYRLVERDASDRLVLVEIDQRSLRTLDVWPWPRNFHATLIDRLNDAGAAAIALDIDFSSRSTPEADAAFEQALARAGKRVILPIIRQRLSSQGEAATIAATRPLDNFARHATTASVVVRPDSDGRVRSMQSLRTDGGETAPSMAALLGGAGRSMPANYYIDFGIRPQSIPRLSYVDVLRGEFPADLVKGRDVLVGATAIELGDQLAVPVHVIAPGSLVLALSAESIREGRALVRTGPYPALLVALALIALLSPRFQAWHWGHSLGVVAISTGGIFAASVAAQSFLPLAPDAAPAIAGLWLAYGAGLVALVQRQTMRIFRQRLEVQQNNLMMRQIVENSFDAIVVVGWDGRVVLNNRAAEHLFGDDGHDLRGRPLQSLFRAESADADHSIMALLERQGEPATLTQGFAIDRHGKDVPVELSVAHMVIHPTDSALERRDRTRMFHFIAARNISARVAAENARDAALAEAQAASRAKSQFLATVSHELRTPLNAIIGFSEVIKDQMFGAIGNPQYSGYANDIHSSGQHLLQVINDILDVTRVEAGEMKLEETRVRLAGCAESALRLLSAQWHKKAVQLRTTIDAEFPPLIGDERLVKQILVNLVSNAIKFTPADGSITIAAAQRPDGGVVLSVADTGIGIPAEQIEKLGRPFYQVDQSHTRKFEGIGLGLSIVRGLMALHGGTMTIRSKVGLGTVIICDFPAARTASSARAAA